jgi:hypothetical protein
LKKYLSVYLFKSFPITNERGKLASIQSIAMGPTDFFAKIPEIGL